MPWVVSLILFLITNWKSIYELVKLIVSLIKREKDPSIRKVMVSELTSAMSEFHRSGDKGPLERLLAKMRANCEQ